MWYAIRRPEFVSKGVRYPKSAKEKLRIGQLFSLVGLLSPVLLKTSRPEAHPRCHLQLLPCVDIIRVGL
jgi:hypothetical protein